MSNSLWSLVFANHAIHPRFGRLSLRGSIAYDIMALKLQTYLKFNTSYPGFGGYLPWYTGDQIDILPTWDWVNRVPALDNGYVDEYSLPPI
jgi:hypothetical protein